jgi:hypothetical protein
MEPIVHRLENEYAAQIVFERVNVENSAARDRMLAYGLRGHPSYAIVSAEGLLLWSGTGEMAGTQLRGQLERVTTASR